jgi:hypothetical protein
MVSASQWPRSFTSHAVEECSQRFQRLDSNATTASTVSASRDCNGSFEDAWGDAGIQPATPPTPIHTLRPTDPPLELEIFWTSRRPSTRTKDFDVEKGPLDVR